MEKKYGITNIKPILAMAIEMGNVADKMGRIKGMGRYLLILDLFDELTALGNVEFKLIKEEIKELDIKEREELYAFLKEKFDIMDEKMEFAIEEGLKIVEEAYGLVSRSISLFKGLEEVKL